MTELAIWDKAGAMERLNHKQELFEKILRVFFDTVPGSLETIQQSVQQDDRNQIKISSHTLKGQSATVGATRLCALCFEMEQNHATFELSELDQLLKDIRLAYEEFQALATGD